MFKKSATGLTKEEPPYVCTCGEAVPQCYKDLHVSKCYNTEYFVLALKTITRALNLDKIIPSYQYCITVSCLNALNIWFMANALPPQIAIYRDHLLYGHHPNVRRTAVDLEVGLVMRGNLEEFDVLLAVAELDPSPFLRCYVMQSLANANPFASRDKGIAAKFQEHKLSIQRRVMRIIKYEIRGER